MSVPFLMFERCSKNKFRQLTLVSISLCVFYHRSKAVELGAHVCNPWLGLLGPVFWLKSLGANGAFTVLRPCTVLGCTYLVQVVLVLLFLFFSHEIYTRIFNETFHHLKACAHLINGVRHPKPHSFRQNHTPSFWSSQVVHEVNKGSPSWPELGEQKFVIVCLYAVSCRNNCKVYLVVKVLTI